MASGTGRCVRPVCSGRRPPASTRATAALLGRPTASLSWRPTPKHSGPRARAGVGARARALLAMSRAYLDALLVCHGDYSASYVHNSNTGWSS